MVAHVALNVWLISAYSWRGAAWASITCDAVPATTLSKLAAELKRYEDYALAD